MCAWALDDGPGLIPAHAGKTERRVVVLRAIQAHPRSRGENGGCGGGGLSAAGSSPLTRGKRGFGFGVP